MTSSSQLATHIRQVFFGGNWTTSNMKQQLSDVSWQQATTPVGSLNTIATLFGHSTYYIRVIARRLEGHPLEGSDKESFSHPPIKSEQDWNDWLNQVWQDVEHMAKLVEQLPDSRLMQDFAGEKHGICYRHILGFIEHTHYHLGQMVLIKKLLSANTVRNH